MCLMKIFPVLRVFISSKNLSFICYARLCAGYFYIKSSPKENFPIKQKSTVRQTVHPILCNWLPFYRPCSFASQTFIWFANFLIIAFKLMQKNWFYYTIALYRTQEKHYRFNVQKQKKNSRYIHRTVLLLPKSTQH